MAQVMQEPPPNISDNVILPQENSSKLDSVQNLKNKNLKSLPDFSWLRGIEVKDEWEKLPEDLHNALFIMLPLIST